MLEKGGSKTIEIGGHKVKRSVFLASAVWQAVTEKKVTLPDGKEMQVGTDDWWKAVEFIYKQIDGPPKAEVALTGKDGKDLIPEQPSVDEIAMRVASLVALAQQRKDNAN